MPDGIMQYVCLTADHMRPTVQITVGLDAREYHALLTFYIRLFPANGRHGRGGGSRRYASLAYSQPGAFSLSLSLSLSLFTKRANIGGVASGSCKSELIGQYEDGGRYCFLINKSISSPCSEQAKEGGLHRPHQMRQLPLLKTQTLDPSPT